MNKVDIMNRIPEDIVGHIMSFIYDKRGYHYIDYKRRKRKMDFKMKRVIAELILFQTKYEGDMAVLKYGMPNYSRKYKEFLNNLKDGKPTITYHTGLYENIRWERNRLKKMAEEEEKYNRFQNRKVIWRLVGDAWKVEIKWENQKHIWQNTYKRMDRKARQENQKWKSNRRMLNDVERSKKWNRSMATAANSIL